MLLDTQVGAVPVSASWSVFSSAAPPALPFLSEAVRDACVSFPVATYRFLAGGIAVEVEGESDCAISIGVICGIAAEKVRCTD